MTAWDDGGAAPGAWLVDASLPGPVAHIVIGRFAEPGRMDAALVGARHVQLLRDAPAAAAGAASASAPVLARRRLARACVLPLQAPVRDAKALPRPDADQVGRRGACLRARRASSRRPHAGPRSGRCFAARVRAWTHQYPQL